MSADDDHRHSAADEPTAMWNADALREGGFEDVAEARESDVPPPATTPARGDEPSVQLATAAGPARVGATAAPAATGARFWVLTVLLAITLGGAVFALVRLLR